MGRTFGWRSLLVVVMATACSEDKVTAPGACPEFCGVVSVQAVDTLLGSSINRDSSYTGYVPAYTASQIMVAGPGGARESRAVLRFLQFADTVPLNPGDTARRAVLQTDSFTVLLVVNRTTAGLTGLRFRLYRLPQTVDSATTYNDVAPWFQDSTFIRDTLVPVPEQSDSITILLPASAFPDFQPGNRNVTLGVALSGPAAFAELGTSDQFRGAVLSRWVTVDSVGPTRARRVSSLGTLLDTYVFDPIAPAPATVLTVGGAPSARSFIRLNVPSRIVDSANIVRATLVLIPQTPVIAAPGDTLVLLAHSLSSDIGPKSPVRPAASDSAGLTGARLVNGMTDTIRVDITDVMRSWKQDTITPRTLVLRIDREGGSFGQLRFWSTADATRRPVIDLTYVPQVRYEGR
jgi:hypothetical protein